MPSITPESDPRQALAHQLIVELGQPGPGLTDQSGEEQPAERQRQTVLPHHPPHAAHRCSTPITTKNTNPVTITAR